VQPWAVARWAIPDTAPAVLKCPALDLVQKTARWAKVVTAAIPLRWLKLVSRPTVAEAITLLLVVHQERPVTALPAVLVMLRVQPVYPATARPVVLEQKVLLDTPRPATARLVVHLLSVPATIRLVGIQAAAIPPHMAKAAHQVNTAPVVVILMAVFPGASGLAMVHPVTSDLVKVFQVATGLVVADALLRQAALTVQLKLLFGLAEKTKP
jgi:hypothetical protein